MTYPPDVDPALPEVDSALHEEPQQSKIASWWNRPAVRRSLSAAGLYVGLPLLGIFVFVGVIYFREARRIDRRLADGLFGSSLNIYASPLTLTTGDGLSLSDMVDELQTAGYQASSSPQRSTFHVDGSTVQIYPNESAPSPTLIGISNGRISSIQRRGKAVGEFTVPSPVIATVSSGSRQQRQMVTFAQIPPALVQAVISAEDKHFFHHGGFDLPRIAKAAWVDIREHRMEEGASTLTMQLVRGLWLGPAKTWRRKIAEVLMAVHLESHWPKEKIFETYANEVYLGRRAAWNIHGFAEGAHLFFGKDLNDLTLSDTALLAGLVQRPSYDNPLRSPERARRRRNVVLAMMRDNRYITAEQYEQSSGAPIHVIEDTQQTSSDPWAIDMVNDEIQGSDEGDRNPKTLTTTIDLNLQRAAEEAVAAGLSEVDRQLARRYAAGGEKAQVALIALDPHTGEIKAMVGGRDYSRSQLNHIFAKRPPGSVFKPFVYAAALNTALTGGNTVYTPATLVDDSPETFFFGGRPYTPSNFRKEFYGTMTLRQALARSDNTAAVKVAEGVGLQNVVAMARLGGLNNNIRATPAVALGAYEATPLEMAGAYTMFANGGVRVRPTIFSEIQGRGGKTLEGGGSPQARQAINPALAWLMVNMLEEVMRSGTAAGVRSRGFTLPAAGKTGTSHDGWFVGFTSQLLCIVWVGFDDYSELGLEGAKSALPIWTEFMKRATRFAAWRNAREFPAPGGIEKEDICVDDGKLAAETCTNRRTEYFIKGSAPRELSGTQPDPNQIATQVVVDPQGSAPPSSPLPFDPNRARIPSDASADSQVQPAPNPPVPLSVTYPTQ